MGRPGTSWGLLGPPGTYWGLLGALGTSWGLLRPRGASLGLQGSPEPGGLLRPPGCSWGLLGPVAPSPSPSHSGRLADSSRVGAGILATRKLKQAGPAGSSPLCAVILLTNDTPGTSFLVARELKQGRPAVPVHPLSAPTQPLAGILSGLWPLGPRCAKPIRQQRPRVLDGAEVGGRLRVLVDGAEANVPHRLQGLIAPQALLAVLRQTRPIPRTTAGPRRSPRQSGSCPQRSKAWRTPSLDTLDSSALRARPAMAVGPRPLSAWNLAQPKRSEARSGSLGHAGRVAAGAVPCLLLAGSGLRGDGGIQLNGGLEKKTLVSKRQQLSASKRRIHLG